MSLQYRLAPGYHLVPSDEGWLLYRPDGLFARLRVKTELSAAAAEILAGDEPSTAQIRSDELDAFFEALRSQEVIVPIAEADAEHAENTAPTQVAIEGAGPLASRLAELLDASGLEARVVPLGDFGAGSGSRPDVVVCCAGWIPDARFTALDAWCAEHGVPWHGVYAEGCRFHLGPFWLPDDPRTVRYADARARRLAADVHPDGLEAYWRYLDAGRRVPPPSPPTPAEAALVAGALAADLLAYAAGRRPPSYGHQLAFDRTNGRWRRHPVLPVPRGLMTEAVP